MALGVLKLHISYVQHFRKCTNLQIQRCVTSTQLQYFSW